MRSRQDLLSPPVGATPGAGRWSSVDGHDEDADDDLDEHELLTELNGGDILVTGFAVASNSQNAYFHELFKSIPEGDYLIEGASIRDV
jgi:hypothetical protein